MVMQLRALGETCRQPYDASLALVERGLAAQARSRRSPALARELIGCVRLFTVESSRALKVSLEALA